jgi:hypothetical protein
VLAEVDAQQDFVDILAKDVIKPLETLKVSRGYLVFAGIPVLTIGCSGRNGTIIQKNGSRTISKNLPRVMLIMQRTGSHSSSRHTRGNINLRNVLTLPMFRSVLRTF